jgi:hypothetical protein
MRRAVIVVVVGSVLLVGSVVGFVIVSEHKPQFIGGDVVIPGTSSTVPSDFGHWLGWSHTAYDAARIGTWALLIAGVLLVALGLINYARRSRHRPGVIGQ